MMRQTLHKQMEQLLKLRHEVALAEYQHAKGKVIRAALALILHRERSTKHGQG
jgi:hypothetical protein